MMKQLRDDESLVQNLRKRYPAGCRVKLIRMEDPQAPPVGTEGTVLDVDDMGSILVCWDNGSSLSIAYGIDRCRKISE